MFGLGRMAFIAFVGHCSATGPVTFKCVNRIAGPLCGVFARLLPGTRALSKVKASGSFAFKVISVVKPFEPCGKAIRRIVRKLVG